MMRSRVPAVRAQPPAAGPRDERPQRPQEAREQETREKGTGRGIPACALVLLLCSLPNAARADEVWQRAARLAREGRCEAALPELSRAIREGAPEAPARLLSGQCLIRLQRFGRAAEELEAARRIDPDLEGVDLSLAIARYHLGRPDAAREALARAEARDPERAAVQLYRGLLLLDEARHEGGVEAFERARALDPLYAEPVASFYEGMALAALADRERARELFESVIRDWPGTAWADEARRALEGLAESQPAWWLEASAGLEYDSNVVLEGEGVSVSDQDDGRGVFTFSAGTPVYQDDDWTFGVLGGYWGTAQFDLTAYDTQYPTASVWLDRQIDEQRVARLQYEFGYAWLDGDDYLADHTWRASFFQGWEVAGLTQVWVEYERSDYKFDRTDVPSSEPGNPCVPTPTTVCGPPGLDEANARNRDGWGIAAGIEQLLPLPDWRFIEDPGVRAGYEFVSYDARGREFGHDAHGVWLGVQATLPFEIAFDAEASFTYRPYDHPTTYPDPGELVGGTTYTLDATNRREKEWTLATSLERALTENLSLTVRWSYDDNRSTSDVYDYRRHIVGAYLTGRIGP